MPQLAALVTLTLVIFMSEPLTLNGENVGTTIVDGDIYVHVMAAIYTEINETGTCTKTEAEAVQHIEAIKWIFQRLNADNYIPGVRIGVRISETCGSIDKAKKVALDLSAELAENETNMRTVGVIGHDYSAESEAISTLLSGVPDRFRLIQMSYFATALSLRDRNKYPNFFRVVPSDDLQVETFKEFIQAMSYTYMALIYSDDAYGRGLKELLHTSIGTSGPCIPVTMTLSRGASGVSYIQDVLHNQLINASPPISGLLIFVSQITTTENILSAIRNIVVSSNTTPPVFLLSEASAYLSDTYKDVIKGAFVLTPRRNIVQQFNWTGRLADFSRLYEEVKSNLWLRDMYLNGFGCELADNFTDNTCGIKDTNEIEASFPNSVYTQYTIQAALTMAKTIKDTYLQTCSSGGLCTEFLSLPRSTFIDTANSITVHYDNDFGAFEIDEFKSPDLITAFDNSAEVVLKTDLPLYEVYNVQSCGTSLCQIMVGEVSNAGQFSLQKDSIQDYFDPEARHVQCPDGYLCSTCIEDVIDESILFIPGDLYVVGIVPIHEKGTTPLQCGTFKSGGVDIVEAIRFAIQEETLDASVGVIIIDSCNDPQIIQEQILTLHRLGVYKGGVYLPVADMIIGYIGGRTSGVSKAVAELMTRLGIPQISYASTATSLSRRSVYKYFLRIPTPDNEQAKVMVDLVKDHIKTNYVQILYSESEYGEGGRDILIERAGEVNICVAQLIGINEATDVTTIVPKLRRQQDAKVVLVFTSSTAVARMLKSLNDGIESGEFIFIASDGWGRRYSVGTYTNLVGTISLTSELDINNKFVDRMSELSIRNTNTNFWVRPYIEWYFGCYSQWNFNKTSNNSCSKSLALDESRYNVEVWSAFTERAVNVLLNGAKQAMNKYCGNSRTICDALRNNSDSLIEEIKSQTYLENGNNIRIFDENGDGRAGYRIYVVSGKQGEQYYQIGQSNPDSAIFFETNKYLDRGGKVLDYKCSGQPKCLECFPEPPSSEEDSTSSIGLMIALVILGVLCVLLGAVQVVKCLKYGCCLKMEHGGLGFKDGYINPINGDRSQPNEDNDYNTIKDDVDNTDEPGSSGTQTESAGSGTGHSGSSASRSEFDPPPGHAVTYTKEKAVPKTSIDFGVDPSQINFAQYSQ